MRHHRRRRLAAAYGAVIAIPVAGLTQLPAGGDEGASTPTVVSEGAGDAQEPYQITLITGDVVSVQPVDEGEDAGSGVQVDAVQRPDGTEPSFEIHGSGKGDAPDDRVLTVIPDDAAALVAEGRVDRDLFDVELLHRHGFDDETPVISIFSEGDGQRLGRRADALAGASDERTLTSINGTSFVVSADDSAKFWQSVQDGTTEEPATLLDQGVERLFLDRPVQAVLDESVPQVRAPEAWAGGVDGTGVTVAVLDTGIDADHSDVADRIVAGQSFIAGEDVADGHGHGTHVASTIAGTGDASDGLRKGVAPGADLVIGKVLDDSGSGAVSGIIDGMEWAVDQGASVINMSLGTDALPNESDDPLVQAVNSISASDGALFVVAAGNEGRSGASTIGTPGVAESALTVGAVDKADSAADFSSRDPLLATYDRVLKPDIAAPGVAIGAARAAETSMGSPINDFYTRANGTSMATPHVAGAAALVAQAHPEWSGQEIKDALSASADDVGDSVFTVGSGRLDVAGAVSQTVTSRGGVDFGRSDDRSTDTVSTTVEYTNTAADATVLTLDADLRHADSGEPVPADRVELPGTVEVAGGETAEITVALDPSGLDEGEYTGTLTATDENGATVRTAAAYVRDPHTVRVVAGVDCGNATSCSNTSGVYATNLDNPDHSANSTTGELHLRPGRYNFSANVGLIKDRARHSALLVRPEIVIEEDPPFGVQKVKLDIGAARQVDVETDRTSENYSGVLTFQRRVDDWYTWGGWLTDYHNSSLWVLPAPEVTVGEYLLSMSLERGAVPLTAGVVGDSDVAVTPIYRSIANSDPRLNGQISTELVDVGATLEPDEAAEVDGAIALARPRFIDIIDQDSYYLSDEHVRDLTDAGAVAILVWSPDIADGVPGVLSSANHTIPIAGIPTEQGAELTHRLQQGSLELELNGTWPSPYLYSLKFYERDQVPWSVRYDVSDSDLAEIPTTYRPGNGGDSESRNRTVLGLWDGGGELYNVGRSTRIVAPSEVTNLVGPLRDDQGWYRWDDAPNVVSGVIGYRYSSLAPGRNAPEVWNELPHVPGAATRNPDKVRECTTCRQGDVLWVRPTLTFPDESVIADRRAPGVYLVGSPPGPKGLDAREVTLFDGEQQLSPDVRNNNYMRGFTVPAELTTLRMMYDSDDAGQPGSAYGQSIHSEWTFQSERTGDDSTDGTSCEFTVGTPRDEPCEIQPLLQVRLQAELDELNRAPRNGSKLTLTAYHESSTLPSAEVQSAEVSVSFDDGDTWEAVQVRGHGDTRKVNLPAAPADATAVTLRIDAIDEAGATVHHELVRAFGLQQPGTG